MRLTPLAKLMLALLIVGTVGLGLYVNRHKLGANIQGIGQLLSSSTPGGTQAPIADAGSGQPRQNVLVIEGSSALVQLLESWGKLFAKDHPGVKVQHGWGDTPRGIKQVIAGTVDMAATVRTLKDNEQKLASEKGVQVRAQKVGLDGIGVIVNRGNPVAELSMQQLAGIYSGQISNWQQVGGRNMSISFYVRPQTSAMTEFIIEKFLSNENYSPKAKVARTTTELVQIIGRDPGAIGTSTIAHSLKQKTVKLLGISRSQREPAVYPYVGKEVNSRAISEGHYPLIRELYLLTRGEPGGLAKDFIDMALSGAGQQVLAGEGYVPML